MNLRPPIADGRVTRTIGGLSGPKDIEPEHLKIVNAGREHILRLIDVIEAATRPRQA
jgi:hypothetical protein